MQPVNQNVGQPQVNPFVQLLQKLQSQGGGQPQAPNQNMAAMQAAMRSSTNPPGATPPGGAPVGAGQATGLPGAAQPQVEDAALPGQNPGSSKQLIGAMNLLHQAITAMTDPQEIRMLRSIIILLTNLIQADQQKYNATTGNTQAAQQAGPQGGPGAGPQPRGPQGGGPQGPGQAPGFPSPGA
jgi:hypothetical protein